jgi:chlorobactene lauroyltransferase
MLTAKKSAWFEKVFAVYNRNLFKRRFHSLKAANFDFLRERDARKPLIIYANHSSWWDGLVAFEISRATDLDSFILMEEKHLKKLFLFRQLGAFSVVRDKAREALKSINYSVELLKKNPNRALWIFPQGAIQPNDLRPISFYNGISRIVEKLEECNVVSLAIRYEFLGEYKPQIFVKVNEPELVKIDKNFNSKLLTKNFELNLTRNLDELKANILTGQLDRYEKIF